MSSKDPKNGSFTSTRFSSESESESESGPEILGDIDISDYSVDEIHINVPPSPPPPPPQTNTGGISNLIPGDARRGSRSRSSIHESPETNNSVELLYGSSNRVLLAAAANYNSSASASAPVPYVGSNSYNSFLPGHLIQGACDQPSYNYSYAAGTSYCTPNQVQNSMSGPNQFCTPSVGIGFCNRNNNIVSGQGQPNRICNHPGCHYCARNSYCFFNSFAQIRVPNNLSGQGLSGNQQYSRSLSSNVPRPHSYSGQTFLQEHINQPCNTDQNPGGSGSGSGSNSAATTVISFSSVQNNNSSSPGGEQEHPMRISRSGRGRGRGRANNNNNNNNNNNCASQKKLGRPPRPHPIIRSTDQYNLTESMTPNTTSARNTNSNNVSVDQNFPSLMQQQPNSGAFITRSSSNSNNFPGGGYHDHVLNYLNRSLMINPLAAGGRGVGVQLVNNNINNQPINNFAGGFRRGGYTDQLMIPGGGNIATAAERNNNIINDHPIINYPLVPAGSNINFPLIHHQHTLTMDLTDGIQHDDMAPANSFSPIGCSSSRRKNSTTFQVIPPVPGPGQNNNNNNNNAGKSDNDNTLYSVVEKYVNPSHDQNAPLLQIGSNNNRQPPLKIINSGGGCNKGETSDDHISPLPLPQGLSCFKRLCKRTGVNHFPGENSSSNVLLQQRQPLPRRCYPDHETTSGGDKNSGGQTTTVGAVAADDGERTRTLSSEGSREGENVNNANLSVGREIKVAGVRNQYNTLLLLRTNLQHPKETNMSSIPIDTSNNNNNNNNGIILPSSEMVIRSFSSSSSSSSLSCHDDHQLSTIAAAADDQLRTTYVRTDANDKVNVAIDGDVVELEESWAEEFNKLIGYDDSAEKD